MSRLYGPVHRSLQDRFDTRRLADNVETRVVLTEIPQEHKAFIESRDAQMPDLYIEGVAGRRRRTSYPKHVDQADRRLDWREVIHARSQLKAVPAHHATWLLDRSRCVHIGLSARASARASNIFVAVVCGSL